MRHPNSPSVLHRRLHCPGSRAAEAPFRHTDDTNVYAAEGIAAHRLAEAVLRERRPASDYVGDTVEEFLVDDAMAEHVQVYVDAVLARGGEHLVEQTLDLSPWLKDRGEGTPKGTADHLGFDLEQGVVYVDDLKFGRGMKVFADDPQLAAYALGAQHLAESFCEVREVVATIHQPRLGHLDSVAYTPDALEEWGRRIREVDEASYAPDAPLAAGGHCRFCKARASCPALREAVTEAVSAGAPDDLAELGRARSFVEVAEAWVSAVKDAAQARAEAGEEVPGWKLVLGRAGARAWSDSDAVIGEGKRARLRKDQLYELKLRSPTQLEKVLGSGPFEKRFGPYVTRPEPRPTLVPAADKRPAVAAGMFENLDQED